MKKMYHFYFTHCFFFFSFTSCTELQNRALNVVLGHLWSYVVHDFHMPCKKIIHSLESPCMFFYALLCVSVHNANKFFFFFVSFCLGFPSSSLPSLPLNGVFSSPLQPTLHFHRSPSHYDPSNSSAHHISFFFFFCFKLENH